MYTHLRQVLYDVIGLSSIQDLNFRPSLTSLKLVRLKSLSSKCAPVHISISCLTTFLKIRHRPFTRRKIHNPDQKTLLDRLSSVNFSLPLPLPLLSDASPGRGRNALRYQDLWYQHFLVKVRARHRTERQEDVLPGLDRGLEPGRAGH